MVTVTALGRDLLTHEERPVSSSAVPRAQSARP
jgi:hypothetical protein